MAETAQSNDRLSALINAPLDRWIALSADESRIVAEGATFAEVSDLVDKSGESDPLIVRVPEDWSPRILANRN